MEPEESIQYDRWNVRKKIISANKRTSFSKERDVWWCSLGLNIGRESYGKGDAFQRPVLIFKQLSFDLCVVLPLTSQERIGNWFVHILVSGEKRWAMLHQIRVLDKKRFLSKMGIITPEEFDQVKEKLEVLLELSRSSPHQSGEQKGSPFQ
jgi:mRNA interferase MazF